MTVERLKARAYGEIATMVFERLFGPLPGRDRRGNPGLRDEGSSPQRDRIGVFLDAFARFAARLDQPLTADQDQQAAELRTLRDEVARGAREPTSQDLERLLSFQHQLEQQAARRASERLERGL